MIRRTAMNNDIVKITVISNLCVFYARVSIFKLKKSSKFSKN